MAASRSSCDPTSRGNVTLRGSLVDANHEIGLFVDGSDAHVETSIIRGTLPRASTLLGGRGVNIQVPCLADVCDPSARSNATLLASLIEQNHEAGVFVMGSEIHMEASVVRDNLPRELDQSWGRGMSIQRCVADGCDLDSRSLATLRGLLIENNREFGMLVSASDATIDSVTVRGTLARASDGNQGDGIAVSSQYVPSTASIVGTRVHDNARAGIGNFSSVVDLATTSVACNQLDLVASHCCTEEPVFRDGGGNVCGCPEGAAECKSTSTQLTPPDPLPAPE